MEITRFTASILDLVSEKDKDFLSKKIALINASEFYSGLLNLFINYSFTEDEAEQHWTVILEKLKDLQHSQKDSLHCVVFDYFMKENKIFREPVILETRFFKETAKLAMHDTLTGLVNRRYFDLALKEELKKSKKNNNTFSVIIIDIDDFKFINDEKGHWFGDDVIKEFSKIILDSARREDVVSRYGGEEFFILLTDTDGDGASEYAAKLKQNIHVSSFFINNPATFSAGISTYPDDGETGENLIKCADKALYTAKFAGKNCIVKYSSDNRRFERFNKRFKFSFTPVENIFKGIEGKVAETLDISIGGLRFETDSYFTKGKKIIINIDLPKKDEITIICTVAWYKETDNGYYEYGLRFNNISIDQTVKLTKYLSQE